MNSLLIVFVAISGFVAEASAGTTAFSSIPCPVQVFDMEGLSLWLATLINIELANHKNQQIEELAVQMDSFLESLIVQYDLTQNDLGLIQEFLIAQVFGSSGDIRSGIWGCYIQAFMNW
ncbi:hypothetical protein ACKWTF_015063 [Chironomus riparius]